VNRILALCGFPASPRTALTAVLFCVGLGLGLVPPRGAGAQTPIAAGFRDFDYGAQVTSMPTGEKPESKLWWTDGFWWGVLWSPSAGSYAIQRFDLSTQSWNPTGVLVDSRSSAKVDALWDGTRLYVLSHVFGSGGQTSSGSAGKLYRYSYDPSTNIYTPDSGYPVTVNGSKSETLVLDKDSSGKLWTTWVEGGKVKVNRTVGNDQVWGTPFDLPGQGASVDPDDISSLVAFAGKIGIMWSNQKDKKMYFAAHVDGNADNQWQAREDALADASLGAVADDHINLKASCAGDGALYAATKTSLSGSDPLTYLLKRAANGSWSRHTIGTGSNNHTRPIVLLDGNAGRAYVFASSNRGGGREKIYMKSSSTTDLQFPTGLGTPFIDSQSDPQANNPTSTKQCLGPATGLLVLSSDQNTHHYMHNYIALGGGAVPAIAGFTPGGGAAGTQVTITGSRFTGAGSVSFNGVAAASVSVDSDTQIRAAVPAGASTGRIRVTTAAGTGISSTDFVVTQPPAISSFTPPSGPVGTVVTIIGTGFLGATAVSFGEVAASQFTVDGNTQVRATVPPGAGTGPIRLTNAAGTAASGSSFIVIRSAVITFFAPASGPAGTVVDLHGANLADAGSVAFNGTAAAFTIVSDTLVRATVPAGATTGRIVATNPYGPGTSATDFMVVVPPAITSFAPASGPVGTVVTITGTGFLGTTAVSFNGVAAASFSVFGSTLIRATAPSGATTGRIQVANAAGSAQSASDFVVTAPPPILTFEPLHDAHVYSASPTTSYGTLGSLRVKHDASDYRSYLKFEVSGIGPAVQSALLRLYCTDESPEGGAIYLVSNDYQGTTTPWVESGLTWSNAPAIGATPVAPSKLVATNAWVEYDVSAAITGSATYSFAVMSQHHNSAYYNSKESGTNRPQLVVQGNAVAPPAITSFAPIAGPAGTEVTIDGSGFASASAVTFNGSPADFVLDGDTRLRATVPPGAGSGTIRVTNPAGAATSAGAFTVTSPPVFGFFAPTSGPENAVVQVHGRHLGNVTAVTFHGTPASYAIASDTLLSATVPVGAATGRIAVSNADGTATSSADFVVLLPPTIRSIAPASGPVGAEIAIRGTGFTGITAVEFSPAQAAPFTVTGDTLMRASVPAAAATGPLRVTNPAGTATSAEDFTVIPPPTVSSFTPPGGPIGVEVTVRGSGFTSATAVAFPDTLAAFVVDDDGRLRAIVPRGARSGPIRVTNPAGSAASADSFLVFAPPTVTAFAPGSGLAGVEVTVHGWGFAIAIAVAFDGTAAAFTVEDDTRLLATVPAGAGSGAIRVTNLYGSGSSTTDFVVVRPPTVLSFDPRRGPAGMEVTVTGDGFTGTTAVKFDTRPASAFNVQSDSQILATVPAGAGSGSILVINPAGAGASADSFTVIAPPTIAGFEPIGGPAGTEVTVRGGSFATAAAVSFNGTGADTILVDSDTLLRARVPAGAGSGPIRVTNPAGTAISAASFTVIPPPAITSFAPASGPVGTVVTITGTGFLGTTAVSFNGVAAASFSVFGSTLIRATAPSGATTGRIQVANAAGSAQSASDFVVTAPPPILTFEPLHDAHVYSASPTTSYGTLGSLRVKHDASDYRSYLKFEVSGIGPAVQSALLRLYCTDESPEGGAIYLVSNDYQGTTTPWVESGLTWSNAPAIGATPVAPSKLVATNAWVEYDVSAAITGSATYSFAVMSQHHNSAYYNSKESGTNRPQLVVRSGSSAAAAIASTEPSVVETTPSLDSQGPAIPGQLALGPPYPNPFQARTTIRFELPRPGNVRLTVHDLMGRAVRVLMDGHAPAGAHQVGWDGRDGVGQAVRSGVYLLRFECGELTATRRLLRMR
jgi:IPT/TIG domain-containing protein/flagellar hook capping protein FlgD